MGADNPTEAYAIGSKLWPGLAKLTEEAGEVLQVIGKIQASNGENFYWDGANLRSRLTKELADLKAAINYVEAVNELEEDTARWKDKLGKFLHWHSISSDKVANAKRTD